MGADLKIVADNQPLILFDGTCNFCNASVNFIIKRDPTEKFKFASLQSKLAEKLIGPSDLKMDTLFLIKGNHLYRESEAALRIAKELNGGWKLLAVFIILPAFIRDPVYQLIAKNRYKWFGKKDQCMVPTEDVRYRFLDS